MSRQIKCIQPFSLSIVYLPFEKLYILPYKSLAKMSNHDVKPYVLLFVHWKGLFCYSSLRKSKNKRYRGTYSEINNKQEIMFASWRRNIHDAFVFQILHQTIKRRSCPTFDHYLLIFSFAFARCKSVYVSISLTGYIYWNTIWPRSQEKCHF